MKHPPVGKLKTVLAVTALAFAAGVGFAANQIPPYPTLRWYWSRALARTGPRDNTGSRVVTTTLLNLRLAADVPIPAGRPSWRGGGFTSLGDELLLLTYDGRIFRITDHGAQLADVHPPDNGVAALLRRADDGKYVGARQHAETLRYMQLSSYTVDARSFLVIAYAEWLDDNACYGNAVARLPLERPAALPAAGAEDWEIVYRSQPCLPFEDGNVRALAGYSAGGALTHSNGHTYLLTNGDFEWDGVHHQRALSRLRDNDYGKVIELNVESGAKRIVATGLRNPQGIATLEPGEVYAVEHGPRGGDELNRIVEGGDYGFPDATLGVLYSGERWPLSPQVGRHVIATPPAYAWLPSVGPSNLIRVQGFDPSWDGDLLLATLSGESLFRLRLEDRRVQFAERIQIGRRIRSVHQHTDGRLVLWTDDDKVIFITREDGSLYAGKVAETLTTLPEGNRAEVQTAWDRCLQCHSIAGPGTGQTLGLGDVFGRRIAGAPGFNYSAALRGQTGEWTAARLKQFLREPAQAVPGTTMPTVPLSAAEIDAVVAILQALATVKE